MLPPIHHLSFKFPLWCVWGGRGVAFGQPFHITELGLEPHACVLLNKMMNRMDFAKQQSVLETSEQPH